MAQIIVTVIGRDPAEPGAEGGLEIVAANRPKGFDEDFLSDVLHLIPPAYQVVNE